MQSQLIIVQFSGYHRWLIGRPILVSDGCRNQPAFLSADTDCEIKPKESYLAEVVQSGMIIPGASFSGYIVKPIRKIEDPAHTALKKYAKLRGISTEDRKLVVLGPKAQSSVIRDTSLFTTLVSLVETYKIGQVVPGGKSRVFHVNVQKPIGYDSYVATSPIDIDTADTFALPHASQHPVRVQMLEDLEPTTVLSFELTRKYAPRNAAALVTWMSTGMLTGFLEPTEAVGTEIRERALEFWCNHTHVYRQDQMSEPFVSTWREVIENARDSNVGTSSALPDDEFDGVLLPTD